MAMVESRYLKQKFEVTSYESQENGDTVQVISHEALENIVHNQIAPDVGVKYEFQDMCITRNHCVIRCTVYDKAGRRIQAIGETVPETLETEISRNYPALMASQRAFDRAVIRYLDLPGKTLSSLENLSNDAVNNGETTVDVTNPPSDAGREGTGTAQTGENNNGARGDARGGAAATGGANAPEGASGGQPPVQNGNRAPANRAAGAQPNGQAPSRPNTPPEKSAAAPAAASNAKDPGAVMCAIGRYRTKPKTIAEVYSEDPGYVKWIIEKYTSTTQAANDLRSACVEYMKQVGGNG